MTHLEPDPAPRPRKGRRKKRTPPRAPESRAPESETPDGRTPGTPPPEPPPPGTDGPTDDASAAGDDPVADPAAAKTAERNAQRGRIYQAAWLYYKLNYTQSRIAELFQVNKGTISRWLASAREQRIVKIEIHPPGIAELEARLKHAFGLQHAWVTPGMADSAIGDPHRRISAEEIYDQQMEELGKAAAQLVGAKLKGNQGIGLAGGRGVASFATHFPLYCPLVAVKLYSLGTSSREPFEIGATAVTAIAANALHSHRKERARMGRDRGINTSVPKVKAYGLRLPGDEPDLDAAAARYYDEAMREIHFVVAGVGDLEEGTGWVPDEEEKKHLTAQGALGELVYNIYGEGGTPIEFRPSRPVYSFTIERLRKLVDDDKHVIIICKDRISAIYPLLAGPTKPCVSGIVTDQPTARKLLERFDQEETAR